MGGLPSVTGKRKMAASEPRRAVARQYSRTFDATKMARKAGKKFIAAACGVATLSALLPLLAYAQAAATARGSAVEGASSVAFDFVTDVLSGNNTRGPYFLTWRGIDQATETVVADGIRLHRGDDYGIDYAGGVITFTRPIPAGSLVRISYRQIAGVSARNQTATTVPITLDLSRSERGSFSIIGLFKPNRAAGGSAPAAGILGMSGSRKFGSGLQTSTLFLTGPDSDARGAGFWARSAMKLGAAGAFGRATFAASFQRAGQEFGGAQEYSLQKGKEVADVSFGVKASERLSASSSFKRVEDIANGSSGPVVTTTEQKVVYTPSKTTLLTASHGTLERESAGAVRNSATVDQVQIKKQFGTTVAAADVTQTTVEAGGTKDTISSQRISVNSAPASNLTIKASLARQSYESKGDDSTTAVQVSANPIRSVALQANYSARDSDFAADEELQSVRLQATPTGSLKISAGVGQRQIGESREATRDARAELSILRSTTISGSYIESSNGSTSTTVREVTAASRPLAFLELRGRYKEREDTLGDRPDTTGLDVTLKPARRLSVVGKYSRNPEDSKGVVRLQEMRSLGLATQIGDLGLSGALSISQDFAAANLTKGAEYGLSLRLFGRGRLATGYKETETFAGGMQGTKQYTLGYVHNAGSAFSLTIGGTMTQYELNNRTLDDRTEYEAQAKVGIRF